jgi:predicted nucleic acid-binding Zn ribbon protein
LLLINPQLLNERGKFNWKETKRYDKYFLIFYSIFGFILLVAALLFVLMAGIMLLSDQFLATDQQRQSQMSWAFVSALALLLSFGMAWLGGMAYVSGDPDRPPVQVSFPQSCLHGGAAAAGATLIALYYRELTGETQWIDVSIQEAVVHTLMNVVQFWDVCGMVLKRSGAFRTGLSTAANQRLIWRCQDGYVNFPIYATAGGAQSNAQTCALDGKRRDKG